MPSIDIDSRPAIARSRTTSKIHVKDILTETDQDSAPRPVNSAPAVEEQTLPAKEVEAYHPAPVSDIVPTIEDRRLSALPWKDNKPRRARRKWTDSETIDLLAGVKKYGIGKWKQILDDSTFSFSERSSVDLKDRYRVCANNDSAPKLETQSTTNTPCSDQLTPVEGAGRSLSPTKANDIDYPGDLNQPPKERRKRRAWTVVEDESLLQGVTKHGFQWTAIHDDPELDLSHRRATDLRDRIRNKFPHGYKHAESAPLRSEVKKAEKLAISFPVGQDAPSLGDAVTTDRNSLTLDLQHGIPAPTPIKYNTPTSMRAVSGKVKSSTSSSSLTMLLHRNESDMDNTGEKGERDKDRDRERDQQVGVTLPSFTLEDDGMDWEDNRLPPLHEWDEIGI